MADVFGQRYPYVVGPTRVSYTPAPGTNSGRVVNGAVKNPTCSPEQGFDSLHGSGRYAASKNAGLSTITLNPGDSLVVGVSDLAKTSMRDSIQQFVVLTCVAAVPPADAFRPPFAGTEKPMHREAQVDWSRLANLAHVGTMPSWSAMESRTNRLLMDLSPSWNRDHLESPSQPPLYGRDGSKHFGQPYLMVNCNYTVAQKRKTVLGLIQLGIDTYGLFRSISGVPWQPDGGHNSGRKFRIMFAGHMLGVAAMRDVVLQTAHTNDPTLKTQSRFHEDAMAFYVTQEHVTITNSSAWKPAYDGERPKQPYSAAMFNGGTHPMPDWRGRGDRPDNTNAAWDGHPYRMSQNHGSQHGQALAALVMGLRPNWRNDAYFDYHARYVRILNGETDPWRFRGTGSSAYNPVSGSTPSGGFPGWQKHWDDSWAWSMVQSHWWTHYKFPWA
jgi:hypothetical protein